MLGRCSTAYEAAGQQAQARTALEKAATIIQGLAEGIGDEVLRMSFLAAPQIQQILQQACRNGKQAQFIHSSYEG